MNEFEIFPNSPITEAIFDIRAKLPDGSDLNIFQNFQEKIKDRFEDRKTRHHFQAEIKLVPGKDESAPVIPRGKADGYLFRSANENKIVQARLDGFTFNKLKPYENWKNFYGEARSLWELYKKIINPIRVDRIGLRYINRIEMPIPFADFNEYILTNPHVAPELPQALSHFFMRIEIPNDEIGALALIILTIQKPNELNKLPLIFDIDVFKNANYSDEMSEMWGDFNNLRNFKNEIFFNSLTDKAKELFR